MKRFVPVLIAFMLASCSEWPDLPAPEASKTDEWPVLLPLDTLLSNLERGDEETAQAELIERAERLQDRADALRRPLPDEAAMERLRQSLSR